MSSVITSLLTSFLLSPLTDLLLPHLSQLLPSLLPPSPRASPGYRRNHRLVLTALILLQLGITSRPSPLPTLYTTLNVPIDADEDAVKRSYRSLSRRFHPDRSGESAIFIAIRQAFETLSDPTRRFAYDKFGPESVRWGEKTVREVVFHGLARMAGYHAVTGGMMLLLHLSGAGGNGFWRVLLLLSALVLELAIVFSPSGLPLGSVVRTLPPFEQVETVRRLSAALNGALIQLGRVWTVSPSTPLSAVMGLVRSVELEAIHSFQSEVVPILRSTPRPMETEQRFQRAMSEVLLDRSVSRPAVRVSELDIARFTPLPREL